MENANELVVQLFQVAFLIEVMPVQIYGVWRQACEYEDKKLNSSINIDVKIMQKTSLCKLKALMHCCKR